MNNINRCPLDESLGTLPISLRGFFQKVIDGVRGVLQVTLMDTLVGEFHDKFNAMWNAPGDRDAAKAVRQCDRAHRETAAKVINEVMVSQLLLLAKAVGEILKTGSIGRESIPDSVLSVLESQVACLEGQMTAIEGLIE